MLTERLPELPEDDAAGQAGRTAPLQPGADRENFSLVLGGPLFQLLLRAQLSDDALGLVGLRIAGLIAITWLPLLLLAVVGGRATGGGAAIPFLSDIEVHVRFLVTMPLLVCAELLVHQRMRPVVQNFMDRRIIPPSGVARFDAAIASAMRWRNSILAEVLLIALVYSVGISIIWRQFIALQAATWYAVPTQGGTSLTVAGVWFGYVSLPVFQFLLCRWYYRLFIWARFLWQAARINLHLMPTPPDRLGGLGFLSNALYSFTILAVAHGTMLAGLLANRILHMKAALPEFKAEIAIIAVFVLCFAIGPLLAFLPRLAAAKRTGLREYGVLAQSYALAFDRKWLRDPPTGEPLLGSADIQSLADMGNSFEIIRSMRILPVTRDDLVRLVVATLIPIAPLALTMMPLEDLVKLLFGVLF